eukprot:7699649-Pyramimonas_sp.AAC.1
MQKSSSRTSGDPRAPRDDPKKNLGRFKEKAPRRAPKKFYQPPAPHGPHAIPGILGGGSQGSL